MSSKQCALDTLMTKVSYAVERLISIQEEVARHSLDCLGPFEGHAWAMLKDLQNELSSALREAHPATMTEQPTSGQTKSSSISNGILETIEVSALVIVQATKILAENGALSLLHSTPIKSEVEELDEEDFNHNADGECPVCMRTSTHTIGGIRCNPYRERL